MKNPSSVTKQQQTKVLYETETSHKFLVGDTKIFAVVNWADKE